jgi:asparagine synthase (glutamine-hydrolysing)
MCGIVAMFSQRGVVAPEALENAVKALKHRGPDGQRHWIASDHRVGLGHARLSIIDLATGDQPIVNEDGTRRIIVNGEFYGYEPIQQELEEAGHRLRTRSDSEIALHLYEELGAHCLHRLRGEFAIVLWDSLNRTLFAARDRFGIKPLFYAFHEGTLYLASEVKALFAAGVPRRWNAESVYYSGGYGGNQTSSIFESIHQVPPGHYLVATENNIQLKQYWDFDYPEEASGNRVRSDAEYVEEFRQVFDESVRLRLRADVPVGCYLSGGIDSCAVLASAARQLSGPIRAFTLTFDRPEYDESAIAREMAAKAKAEFFPVPIRQDQLADEFSDAILQSETLCVNAHGVAKYLLSRAVRDAGYKVVLTGEGSDEILGGYLHFRRDMPINGQMGTASLQRLRKFSATPPSAASQNGNGRDLETIRRLLGFVPGWMETSLALSAKIQLLLARDFVERFKGCDGSRSLLNDIDVASQLAGRDPLHQSLYLWSKTRLPKYLLTLLGDRMEMAHSVEGRVPFLDHRLVEIVRSQPVSQKIHGATQKYVLREAVRDTVTDSVYRRPKHPFLSPPLMLNPKGRFSVLLQDMLRGSVLASMPFFDQKKVVSVLDGLQTADESSRVANDQTLMMVLSACVLHDRFRLSA